MENKFLKSINNMWSNSSTLPLRVSRRGLGSVIETDCHSWLSGAASQPPSQLPAGGVSGFERLSASPHQRHKELLFLTSPAFASCSNNYRTEDIKS